MDFKMNRNGAGYYDETAYKAFRDMAKPGEIWTASVSGREREVLVIKNHGTHCNVLALLDECKAKHLVEITSKSLKYTEPRMLQYLFNDNLTSYVKALSAEEFNKILDEIEEALELNIYRPDAQDAKDELEAAQNKIKHLEEQLAEAKKLPAPSDGIYKRLYDDLIDKLIEKKVV